MQLLDHVSITVRNLKLVKPFYSAVMAALGACVAYESSDAIGFGERNHADDDTQTYISVFVSVNATPDSRRHWCFRASSVVQVYAFHADGIASGGKDEGSPHARNYHAGYYAAFLLDPEGNKIEAVFHHAEA